MRQFFLACLAFLLTACGSEPANQIKVGTISGPETELMEVAKQVADTEFGLKIKIVAFSDYVMPNTALHEGSIDANVYQHLPYLQTASKLHGYQFTAIAKTFIYPMAIYSKKHKSFDSLPDQAVIAIPNDPSNEARALLLLQAAGLIQLDPDAKYAATPADIMANPKRFVFKELDAAQLPRALDDVDLAAINTNFAFAANLLPKRDGLFAEDNDSPYANIVVVRSKDKDNPKLQQLVKALHSGPVLAKAKELFKDQAVIAFKPPLPT